MSNKGVNNIIKYKSTDGEIVNPNNVNFGAVLLSNTYSDIGVIQFDDNVKYFGDNVFFRCLKLTSIEIPNSVTSIGNYAFNECTSLTSIEIPNSVTSVRNSAFRVCESLTSVVIGNNVTSVGNSAFYGCSKLTSVYVKSTTPPTLGTEVFVSNSSNRKIYVPRASLNAYKTASGWSEYADAIEPYDF